MLTANEVLARLERAVAKAPSQAAWARQHGIAPELLNDILRGRRQPSASSKALTAIGVRVNGVRYEGILPGQEQKAILPG